MTPRFHCPLPLAEGAEIALPDAAAHHAARVLRLAAGDAVTLFDGDDGEFTARILRVEPRGVHVRVGAAHAADRESPLAVTLVQGLAAADRMDYAIQKAVELGVQSIQPVTMARSVARLDAGARGQAGIALAAGHDRRLRAVRPQPAAALASAGRLRRVARRIVAGVFAPAARAGWRYHARQSGGAGRAN